MSVAPVPFPVLEAPIAADAASPPGTEVVARLFSEHNRMLVGYLTSKLGSAQEAKEVAQEAYIRLLRLQDPVANGPLRAYLFKVATHLAVDRLRNRAVRQAAEQAERREESDRGSFEDPADQLASRQIAQQLLGFLGELPAKYRQVFDLHRLQGIPQAQVGRQLGMSERMVRRYITYVMVYCRLRLDGNARDDAREKLTL